MCHNSVSTEVFKIMVIVTITCTTIIISACNGSSTLIQFIILTYPIHRTTGIRSNRGTMLVCMNQMYIDQYICYKTPDTPHDIACIIICNCLLWWGSSSWVLTVCMWMMFSLCMHNTWCQCIPCTAPICCVYFANCIVNCVHCELHCYFACTSLLHCLWYHFTYKVFLYSFYGECVGAFLSADGNKSQQHNSVQYFHHSQ